VLYLSSTKRFSLCENLSLSLSLSLSPFLPLPLPESNWFF
jgi:hypothetical protein